ncbi:MAG: SDR family oxidoreductase [Planctomycetaceae bacterium]|nr:SDR family oxidoreductase [Planctomycetaceae bacterium]
MIKELFSLAGRTAVVTGGGRQLGKSIAMTFAEMGANVVVADINEADGNASAEEIARTHGHGAAYVKADVPIPGDHERAVAEAEVRFGRLDIYVNNAGIAESAKGEDMSLAQWQRMIDIDYSGVYYGCRAAFPAFKRAGKGSIINIASMSGLVVNVPMEQPHYNTAKAAVIHLTKSLAVDWSRHAIRVNSISPGYLEGPMSGPGLENPVWGPIWMARSVMKRLGRPEEICGAALLLASDAGSFMTGSNVVVDGGYTCA